MSNTGTGSWSMLADLMRQGVDGFVSTQKMLLDIAAQQNALWMGAFQQNLTNALTPALADMAGKGAQAFVQSQKMLLDLALQQNELALNMIKQSAPGPAGPLVNEIAEMVAEGALAFVETQKQLLDFAAQHAEIMLKAGREGGAASPNLLSQIVEMTRQGTQVLLDTQKKFLDMIAQGTASMFEQVAKQRAEDFLGSARETFGALLNTQRAILDATLRTMQNAARS